MTAAPKPLGDSELVIALVGCGKAKSQAKDPVRARDLYIGIPFRMAIRHAGMTADDVHILSAKHGLLSPTDRITPYDFSMVQIRPSQHIEWGRDVLGELLTAYPMRRLRVVFYAGQQYVRPIMQAVTVEHCYWRFENPLEGLGLFERLRWFKENEPPPF